MDTLRGALAALVTGISAALVIVALAILPFLNPVWVSFAQERAQAEAWTGFTTEQLAQSRTRSCWTWWSVLPTST